MNLVAACWLLVVVPLSALRLAHPAAPVHSFADAQADVAAYLLICVAPILGYLVGKYSAGPLRSRPLRLFPPRRARWLRLSPTEARAHPHFGPGGFMASLLIGLLLNVAIRTFEFFAAVPAMGWHAPAWGRAMFAIMAADVVVTAFFYMVCFVMALRAVPLFPRMLLFTWSLDIVMQLYLVQQLSAVGGLPPQLAGPLIDLLGGNVNKVLIGAFVWLPYLLLSERVNVTYRHRVSAPPLAA